MVKFRLLSCQGTVTYQRVKEVFLPSRANRKPCIKLLKNFWQISAIYLYEWACVCVCAGTWLDGSWSHIYLPSKHWPWHQSCQHPSHPRTRTDRVALTPFPTLSCSSPPRSAGRPRTLTPCSTGRKPLVRMNFGKLFSVWPVQTWILY